MHRKLNRGNVPLVTKKISYYYIYVWGRECLPRKEDNSDIVPPLAVISIWISKLEDKWEKTHTELIRCPATTQLQTQQNMRSSSGVLIGWHLNIFVGSLSWKKVPLLYCAFMPDYITIWFSSKVNTVTI